MQPVASLSIVFFNGPQCKSAYLAAAAAAAVVMVLVLIVNVDTFAAWISSVGTF